MKFKKILCPTDFSDPAGKALKVAASMAADYSSELLVVNVVEPIPTVSAADTFPLTYLKQYLTRRKAPPSAGWRNWSRRLFPPAPRSTH